MIQALFAQVPPAGMNLLLRHQSVEFRFFFWVRQIGTNVALCNEFLNGLRGPQKVVGMNGTAVLKFLSPYKNLSDLQTQKLLDFEEDITL